MTTYNIKSNKQPKFMTYWRKLSAKNISRWTRRFAKAIAPDREATKAAWVMKG